MLTRRALFKTASALCVSMANLKRVSAAGPKLNTTVAFDVPRGACDAHVHVVGEPEEFPMSPERDYTPPAATADDLVEMLKFLNIERAVIVTPTVYGNDNSVTLAAIEKLGRDRARGVALVDDQPGFKSVLSLVKSRRAYVKLSEPYRLSKKAPEYGDLVPVVRALLAANPDRLLWGSGWPHVDSTPVAGRSNTDLAPNLPVDTGHLLNLFARWVPDAEIRRTILVENPARLYRF